MNNFPIIIRKNLSDQVADCLRKEIVNQYKANDKLQSIRDLAVRFNVSTVVINQAIVILATEGLLERKHGSGCFIRNFQLSKHVGILIDININILGVSFFSRRVTQLLQTFFDERGLQSKLYIGNRAPGNKQYFLTCPDFIPDVEANRLQGVVTVSTAPTPDWIDPIKRSGIPVVGAYKPYLVHIDYSEMLCSGIRRLIQRGKRRIAIISRALLYNPEVKDAVVSEMAASGVALRPEWIHAGVDASQPGAGWEAVREIWAVTGEKPDGLLVGDDGFFPDVCIALLEKGVRIPDDLMIVTHANKGMGMFCPFPVTLMQVDPVPYAEAKGEMLIRLMHGESVDQPVVIAPVELVEVTGSRQNVRCELKRDATETIRR